MNERFLKRKGVTDRIKGKSGEDDFSFLKQCMLHTMMQTMGGRETAEEKSEL